MNPKTLKKLEFDKIQKQLLDYTFFEGGRKKILAMKPSSNYELVIRLLDETEEAMEILRYGRPEFLSGLKVLDDQLKRVKAGGLLNAAELWDIYCLLSASRKAVKCMKSYNCSRLSRLAAGIEINSDLEKKLHKAVSHEGTLRDDASPALKNIRNQINSIRLRIREYLQEFIRSSNNQKMLQDLLVTERDGRYVVPVKQEYRNEVKGVVHDESASGATVFVEPLAVVEQNNRIRRLQIEERREIERILRDLSQAVASFALELIYNLDILGELDCIFARAQMAYKTDSYRPCINTSGVIDISRGKHPLLGEKAVPLDIKLGEDFDILVITGPNTGGKTVALKTIGLLCLMAMSGLFIPARENSRISIFKSVLVDIGDEQSIEQSLSTFSSHMSNIITILKQVDERSLVLLDELGAGTDPVEGAVLARVILEELRDKKAKVVVTTHQSELKTFAYQNGRVENACVEFDPITLKPTYKLTIGMPGQSNAFEIASRLGLKRSLVQKAKEMLPEREMEIGNMIRQLQESRRNLDVSSREIEILKEQLLKEREFIEKEKQKLYLAKEEILSQAREEAKQYLSGVKREADEAIKELKELLKKKEQPPKWHEIETARRKLKEINLKQKTGFAEGNKTKVEQEIKVGDYVLIEDINQNGYVLEGPNSQGETVVQVGALKLSVKKELIKKSDFPGEKGLKRYNQSYHLEKARHISKEIDVRGKTVEDALIEIDKYLDDASLVGLDSVRIIHGKGTGTLRSAIHGYLKNHPHVKDFKDAIREEGGFGVTVIRLV